MFHCLLWSDGFDKGKSEGHHRKLEDFNQKRLATDRKVRGSNPVGVESFRTRPDRPWGPPSLLYNGYRVFRGVKRPGRGAYQPLPSSATVKERVELYFLLPLWAFVAFYRVNLIKNKFYPPPYSPRSRCFYDIACRFQVTYKSLLFVKSRHRSSWLFFPPIFIQELPPEDTCLLFHTWLSRAFFNYMTKCGCFIARLQRDNTELLADMGGRQLNWLTFYKFSIMLMNWTENMLGKIKKAPRWLTFMATFHYQWAHRDDSKSLLYWHWHYYTTEIPQYFCKHVH